LKWNRGGPEGGALPGRVADLISNLNRMVAGWEKDARVGVNFPDFLNPPTKKQTMRISRFRLTTLTGLLAVMLALTTSVPTRVRAANIVEIAAGNPNFSTLVAAVQAAGLVDTLSGPGPFTVFAPTDAAFAKLPEGTIPALLADTNRLRQVLLYHVVGAAVPSASVVSGPVVTVQGAAVTASVTGEGVRINGAQVVTPDIAADNGIIHVINDVLLPPPTILETALATPQLSTLVTAVQAAGLVEAFQANTIYTVFAPTDAAFAKLPEGVLAGLLADTNRLRQVLLYHVTAGRTRSTDLTDGGRLITAQGAALRSSFRTNGVFVNESRVTAADVEASDGVVHLLDDVLLPPPTILETALATPQLSTLVTAVQAAGLVEAFQANTIYTVFAPTDAAFAKLPEGVLAGLLADTNRLRQVLLYHVTAGRTRSTDLTDGGRLITAQGAALRSSFRTNGVFVNESRVAAADVEASDGVVHLLDDVLLPPPDVVGIALGTPGFSTLVTAMQAAGLVEALQGAGPFTVFAPTDAAFAKLPEGTIPALLADTNRLKNILLTHVIQGPRLRASSLTPGAVISLSGSPLRVVLTNGLVVINGATVTSPDIEGLNGVIHVVDEVILPGAGFDGLNPVISKAGDSVTVVWPDVVGGTAVLERSSSLLDPQWSPVTATPLVADGVRKVTLPATADAEFFRVEVEVGGGD
jgi:uncharacterized surface protein with fasciclin (FAS1) repeats